MNVHSSSLAGLPATLSVVLAGDALFAAAFFLQPDQFRISCFAEQLRMSCFAASINYTSGMAPDFVLDFQALVLIDFF